METPNFFFLIFRLMKTTKEESGIHSLMYFIIRINPNCTCLPVSAQRGFQLDGPFITISRRSGSEDGSEFKHGSGCQEHDGGDESMLSFMNYNKLLEVTTINNLLRLSALTSDYICICNRVSLISAPHQRVNRQTN